MDKTFLIVIVALTVLAAGCVPMQSGAVEPSQMEADLSEIRQDMWKINKSNADTKTDLEGLRALLIEQSELDTKSRADLMLEIRELTTEMQILSEKLNDTNYRISNIINKVAVQQTHSSAEKTDKEGSIITIADAGPEELYQTAYADFAKGNYPLAIMGFEEYADRYPESELSDNAIYWIGESYYSQKEFEKAVEVFSKVIEKFEDGDKIPDALLKKGYSYLELNQTAQGVVQLQGLIENYPHTQAARMAKQRLENMGLSPR